MKTNHSIRISSDIWKKPRSLGINISHFTETKLIEEIQIQEENNTLPIYQEEINHFANIGDNNTISPLALTSISNRTGVPINTLQEYCEENNIDVMQS
ncbi:MAG: type II toxin-antitoxin system CcdA family antitoxin [Methanosphaera sp.]|nr:type II toxin-antitoxin system CcdA family antitoxin [Methanosphaera sp.]